MEESYTVSYLIYKNEKIPVVLKVIVISGYTASTTKPNLILLIDYF